jgi:hypothetical protein
MSGEKNQEKKFVGETRQALQSHDYKKVHLKIEELKSTGKVSILPFLLDLLDSDCPELIKNDVIVLAGDLKYQGGVPVIVEYIRNRKAGIYLSQLIASCWQSSLDFSHDLEVFTDCFIVEDYQTALESFTVIEEMLWRAESQLVDSCKQMLMERINEVAPDKMTLYNELIKILEKSRTASAEDYPDLYPN